MFCFVKDSLPDPKLRRLDDVPFPVQCAMWTFTERMELCGRKCQHPMPIVGIPRLHLSHTEPEDCAGTFLAAKSALFFHTHRLMSHGMLSEGEKCSPSVFHRPAMFSSRGYRRSWNLMLSYNFPYLMRPWKVGGCCCLKHQGAHEICRTNSGFHQLCHQSRLSNKFNEPDKFDLF